MKPKEDSEIFNRMMKTAKRIVVTMLCCVPFLIVIAYLCRQFLHGWMQYLLFVAVLGLVVGVEELVFNRLVKRKEAKRIIEGNKDVFK